ncbi:MAG: DUF3552 domain-containing protein, partial [Lachnospiraceae bacterium]|nr:DUF3552 domain-containing protein [Lachnospiraceae bacterium]
MPQTILIALAVALVCILVTALITNKLTTSYLQKSANNTIGNAEEKAREIIDDALKTAESKKRESLL